MFSKKDKLVSNLDSKATFSFVPIFEWSKSHFYWLAGGYCKLNKELLNKQMDHISPLQSWAPELRNFAELPDRPIDEEKCDLVYEKPVYIMKIDAST